MSADPVAVLAAIVAEVAGPGQPFSADSYLPAHLIHDARQAIEEAQAAVPASALEAHETILRARLAKADEMISGLRSEIDSLRKINASAAGPVRSALQEASESVIAFRLQKSDDMIASLRAEIDSLRRPNIPGQPPDAVAGPASMFGPGMACPSPILRAQAAADNQAAADQSLESKYDWQKVEVTLRGPKKPWMTVAEPVKYDTDACAESVRGMKECDE